MRMPKIAVCVLGVAGLLMGSVGWAGPQGKTTICHKPHKNGGNTITVSNAAVSTHLQNHGDYIGVCPTPVTSEGALFDLPNKVVLEIPPGAVSETTEISVEATGYVSEIAEIIEFGPSGTEFIEPVRVTVYFSPELLPVGVSADMLYLVTESPDGYLEPLSNTYVDELAGTISADLTHFSYVFATYSSAVIDANGDAISYSDIPMAADFRMPIGDPRDLSGQLSICGQTTGNESLDRGDELDLLDIGEFETTGYPRIVFNDDDLSNDWIVATAFNNNRNLTNYSTGATEPYTSNNAYHPGEDWNTYSVGDDDGTPVHAMADGIVLYSQTQVDTRSSTRADNTVGFGNIVVLGHQLDDGTYIASAYAHLKEPTPCAVGTAVSKGDVIGLIGSTGSIGEAAHHLHFELIRIRETANAASLVSSSATPLIDEESGQVFIRFFSETFVGFDDAVKVSRGWYWPGSDTSRVASNYLPPSRFIRENDSSGPTTKGVLVVGSANGTVLQTSANGDGAVPFGITPGNLVSVRFSYDPGDASVITSLPDFRSYRFLSGQPESGLEVWIRGQRWLSSDDTTLPGNSFGFVALLRDGAFGSGVFDNFILGGRGDDTFPGSISSSAQNSINFVLAGGDSGLLSSLDLPRDINDIDLSTVLIPENNGGGIGSSTSSGSWFVSYQIDPESFQLRSLPRLSCVGVECRIFGTGLVSSDIGPDELKPAELSIGSETEFNVEFERDSIEFLGRPIRPARTLYGASGEISVSAGGQEWVMSLTAIEINNDRVGIPGNPPEDRIAFIGDYFRCRPEDNALPAIFPNSLGGRCFIRVTLNGDANAFASDDLEEILDGLVLELLTGSVTVYAGSDRFGGAPRWVVGIQPETISLD